MWAWNNMCYIIEPELKLLLASFVIMADFPQTVYASVLRKTYKTPFYWKISCKVYKIWRATLCFPLTATVTHPWWPPRVLWLCSVLSLYIQHCPLSTLTLLITQVWEAQYMYSTYWCLLDAYTGQVKCRGQQYIKSLNIKWAFTGS